MDDPFRKVSPFDKEQTAFEDDPDFVSKEDLPDFVKVPCRKCDGMCVRSDNDLAWVHEDETIRFTRVDEDGFTLPVHLADPNIIDIEEVVDAQPGREPGESGSVERAFGRIDP